MSTDPVLVRFSPELIEQFVKGESGPVVMLKLEMLEDGSYDLHVRKAPSPLEPKDSAFIAWIVRTGTTNPDALRIANLLDEHAQKPALPLR